ncbi:MAG: serine hydrolase, partial [Vicinamibacterales bacterium]
MTKTSVAVVGVVLAGVMSAALVAQDRQAARQALIARGRSLELPTKYVPPPGEKIEHYASGYAKIMCTAVFVSGLDPAFAAENVGYFTAPFESRKPLGTPKIDRQKQTVEVTMPNGTVRVAKHVGSQG